MTRMHPKPNEALQRAWGKVPKSVLGRDPFVVFDEEPLNWTQGQWEALHEAISGITSRVVRTRRMWGGQ